MRVLPFFVVMLACVVPYVALPCQQIGMFRGDAGHRGLYRGPGGSTIIGLQWRVPTDGDVVSSPVVAGNIVYVGSGSGALFALSKDNGRTLWRYDAGNAIHSSPAIGAGLVFVASRDGVVHAVNAASGKVVWRRSTGALAPLPWGHESGDRFVSSPVYAHDQLVVGAGDGFVYRLDPTTGAIRWRAATGGRVRGTPAIADGRAIVGSFDGRVYAFSLASGKELWRYATEGATLHSEEFGFDRRSIQSSPAVDGNTVFVGARDGFLYAIDATTGALRWRADHKVSWVNSSPAVADGVVYVGSSDGHFVQAVDGATGVERWRFTTGPAVVWSSPALTAKYLYYGDGAGRLHIGERATGADLAVFRTGAGIFSSPAIDGDIAYFGSDDGNIYALRLGEGPGVQRRVFADTTYATGVATQDIARYFVNRGYQSIDGGTLVQFFADRIQDRAPSVVVFAVDAIPREAIQGALGESLFRRYLNSGGKIVWTGLPPELWYVAPGARRAGLNEIAWSKPTALLGVAHDAAIFDARGAHATAAGLRWGQPSQWRTSWSVDSRGVTTVLGLDEFGLAASWVKNYGGPDGTGFVRVDDKDLLAMYLAAEFRPTSQ